MTDKFTVARAILVAQDKVTEVESIASGKYFYVWQDGDKLQESGANSYNATRSYRKATVARLALEEYCKHNGIKILDKDMFMNIERIVLGSPGNSISNVVHRAIKENESAFEKIA